jgi:hypothetical protein
MAHDTHERHPPAEQAGEIVVFQIRRQSQCGECGDELWPGRMVRLIGEKALCLACADLDRLEFLPSGDAAVTRRAKKYSRLWAVVVRWASARKRYERQGLLVEAAAIDRAEKECLADAEIRERRRARDAERRAELDEEFVAAFASAVRASYPGCPAGAERRIAEHACLRRSGRVGRTAAARELAPEPIRLAVIAHIRHEHTNYDELLVRLGDRDSARCEVRERVDEILREWSHA